MRREKDPAAGVRQGRGKIPVRGTGKEADNDASSRRKKKGERREWSGRSERDVTMLADQRPSCPLQKINSLYAQC